MKTIFALIAFSIVHVAAGQNAQDVSVKVLDESGALVSKAQVAAILVNGAYQDAKLDNDEYKCSAPVSCIKVFVAAQGFEASVKNYPPGGRSVSVTLKPSTSKNSVVIHRTGPLPGIDGDVNPKLDSSKRTYLYATKIGLYVNGRPAQQPLSFSLRRQIDASDPTGHRFKIWVVDITQEVSLLEYTMPK